MLSKLSVVTSINQLLSIKQEISHAFYIAQRINTNTTYTAGDEEKAYQYKKSFSKSLLTIVINFLSTFMMLNDKSLFCNRLFSL